MAIAIKPLRKFTTGTPTTGDMVEGELAVNTADQKIWVRDGSSNIVEVGNVSAGGGGSGLTNILLEDGEDLLLEDFIGGIIISEEDNSVMTSVTIGEAAPSSPSAGDLWWDSTDDDGNLKIYYTDITPTSQWVTTSPGGGTVAGSNTQIQFNNSGEFGASSNLTWTTGTNTLAATNIAGTLSTASQTNITGIGTITTGTLSTGAVLAGVTMTLGSDADGDTYYRASNVLTRLAKGTAAQVLTMNGGATAPEWAAAAGGDVVDDTTPQLGGDLDINSQDIVTTSNGDIDLDPNGSGVVVFKGNATKGSGQFKLNCEQNTHAITIKGPPHSAAAAYTLVLPNDDGDADQVLKTDGAGNLDWVDQSGGGGGGITTGKAIAMAMVFG